MGARDGDSFTGFIPIVFIWNPEIETADNGGLFIKILTQVQQPWNLQMQ
jgi:hypothetical protein